MPSLPDIPGKSLIDGTTKRARVLAAGASAGALAVGGVVAKRVLGGRGGNEGPDADPIAQTPTAPPAANGDSTAGTAEAKPPAPKAEPAKATPPKAKPAAPKPPNAKPAAPKPKAAKPKPPVANASDTAERLAPEPAPAKPKADKPKPVKPKAPPAKPKADKPKTPPAKPKADSKPAKPKAAPKPASNPKAKAAGKPKAAKKQPLTTGTDAPPKPEFEPGNISGDKNPHRALNNPVGDPDGTEYPDPFDKRADPRGVAHPAAGSESTSEPPSQQDPNRAKPPQRDKLDD